MKLLLAVAITMLMTTGAALADVKCVQEFLLQTAFDPGPADGAWGKRTANALTDMFVQIGETVEGGLGKDNSDALCALFSGPRHDELLQRAAFRVYPINIDPTKISGETSRTAFDFSDFEIADDANFSACRFKIVRRELSDGRLDGGPMVDGLVDIQNGALVFGENRWYTGGLADDSYLPGEANLKLTRSGQIVGKTPYFHMFINDDIQAEPAVYVTYSKAFTPDGDFPNGTTEFDAVGMQDGLFYLDCAGGSGGADVAAKYEDEIAGEASFNICLFEFQRVWTNQNNPPEAMAQGTLSIENGKVKIGSNNWLVGGGLATPRFLREDADLVLLNSGQIAGTTPFFHLFINDDTPEQPPLTVVLGTGFEMDGDFPNGTTTFDVPGEPNMRGQLKVSSCS